MPPLGYFVDANLLVLLVVGGVDPEIIAKHRRLNGYTAADHETLLKVLFSRVNRVFITPNTLTEASNLLGQHGEPERSLLMGGLRYIINGNEEIVVASGQASDNPAFQSLGLTDAVLLEAVSEERPLITVDLHLYVAALEKGESVASTSGSLWSRLSNVRQFTWMHGLDRAAGTPVVHSSLQWPPFEEGI